MTNKAEKFCYLKKLAVNHKLLIGDSHVNPHIACISKLIKLEAQKISFKTVWKSRRVNIPQLVSETSIPWWGSSKLSVSIFFPFLSAQHRYESNFPAFLFLINQTLAGSLFDPSDDVVELTLANFDSSVTEDSSNAWIVNFYAPWCEFKKNWWKAIELCWCKFNFAGRYSKRLVPVYKQVATYLKSKVKVGAVNCVDHPKMCDRYDVEGYPTIRMFVGTNSSEYEGEDTVSDISKAATELAPKKNIYRGRPRVQTSTVPNAHNWSDSNSNASSTPYESFHFVDLQNSVRINLQFRNQSNFFLLSPEIAFVHHTLWLIGDSLKLAESTFCLNLNT